MSDLTIKQVKNYKLSKKIKKLLFSRIANIYYSAIPLIKDKSIEEQELLIDLINNYKYILKYSSNKTFILRVFMKINKNLAYSLSNYVVKKFKLY